MTIGERIKQRRLELGLSADDVAAALGKNRATVYRYESNAIEKLPTTVLEPLAEVRNTTPAYLMGWEDDPTDYEIEEENINAPLDVIDYFNGNAKSIVNFERAVAEDATRPEPEDENLIILNRNAKKLSPENRKKLLDMARLMFKEEFKDGEDS